MQDREQAVWAAVYASFWDDPTEGIRRADLSVNGLRLASRDESVGSPELEIGGNSAFLSYEEFRAWYPIALKLATPPAKYRKPTEDACHAAYDRYERSQSDFY